MNSIRLIIALGVMMSAIPSLRATSTMHDFGPAQVMGAFKSADLSDQFDHRHSHDADDLDPNHSPDHGSEHKDHSHVTLGLAGPPASLSAPNGTFVRQWGQCRPSSYFSFRLDRPPCPLFA